MMGENLTDLLARMAVSTSGHDYLIRKLENRRRAVFLELEIPGTSLELPPQAKTQTTCLLTDPFI